MVLILNDEFYERFPQEHHASFHAVIKQSCMSFDALRDTLTPFVTQDETVKLITWDEDLLLVCAELRQHFGLGGPDTARYIPFRDKLVMKEMLRDSPIRVPRHIDKHISDMGNPDALAHAARTIGYPLVIKPIDGSGGIGASVIHDETALLDAIKRSAGRKLDIEEYVEGCFYHCDSIIHDGEIVFSEVCEYAGNAISFMHGHNIGSMVLSEQDDLRNRIVQFNRQVLATLLPPDGVTHLELFHTPTDELVFIEVAARPPGGEIVSVYAQALGVDLYDVSLRQALGLPFSIPPIARKTAAWMYFPNKAGTVSHVHHPVLKSSHADFQLRVSAGDRLDTSHACYERSACCIWCDEDPAVVRNDFEMLSNFCVISMEAEPAE